MDLKGSRAIGLNELLSAAARRNALRWQEYQQWISDDARDKNPRPNVSEVENILAHEQS
jgi:hypothetical protein